MKRKQLFGALLLLAALLALPARGEVKSFTIMFGTGNMISKAWIADVDVNGLKVAESGAEFNNRENFLLPSSKYVTISWTSGLHICKVVAIYVPLDAVASLKLFSESTTCYNQGSYAMAVKNVSTSISNKQFVVKANNGPVVLDKVTVYYIDNYDNNGYANYDREPIIAGNYGTICLPGKVEAGNHTPATIYRIAEKKSDGSAIVLEEVTGDMDAGKPYIFRTELPYFSCYQTAGTEVASAGSDNGLIGSFDGTNVEEGMYLLSNNKVSLCGTGCSIGANRAYIDLDAINALPAAAGAKRITIGVGDGTGIEVLTNADDAVWYDLLGHRVQQPSKGLYICNGKKVFVK